MLCTEYLENFQRVRHYSDKDYYIRQIETNILYEDAVDVIPCKYTYEETGIPIDHSEPEEEEEIE